MAGLLTAEGQAEAVVAHMTEAEVVSILAIVEADSPVLVGGQSIFLWAEMLASNSDWLSRHSVTSEDVDFMHNDAAAKKLAERLGTTVAKPDGDDQTVSAALVRGILNGREIHVDFMRAVHGVEDKHVLRRSVTIEGLVNPGTGKALNFKVMHPLDCLISRFANLNGSMRRVGSAHSRRQATAAISIADAYVEQLLADGNTKAAQEMLAAVEHVFRDHHVGKPSHLQFGAQFPILDILRARLDDERLDSRWREMILGKALARCEERIGSYEARRSQKGEASDSFGLKGGQPAGDGPRVVTPFAERVRAMRGGADADPVRHASPGT